MQGVQVKKVQARCSSKKGTGSQCSNERHCSKRPLVNMDGTRFTSQRGLKASIRSAAAVLAPFNTSDSEAV